MSQSQRCTLKATKAPAKGHSPVHWLPSLEGRGTVLLGQETVKMRAQQALDLPKTGRFLQKRSTAAVTY